MLLDRRAPAPRLLTIELRYRRHVAISWAPLLRTSLTYTNETESRSQLRFLLLQLQAAATILRNQAWFWKLLSFTEAIKPLMCSLDIKTYLNLKAMFSNKVGGFFTSLSGCIWIPELSRDLRAGWFMSVSFFHSIHFLWKGDISSEANIVLLDPMHCH